MGRTFRPAVAVKRLIDIAVAGGGLAFLAPLFALIALLIKLDSRGPVFFRQARAGRHGKPFQLLKFRSMYATTDAAKRTSVLRPDDPLITRVGRSLRATSVDELPQLINVLKGEMSLVGPRPALLSHLQRYDAVQKQRLNVRPGITGWAQVNGRNQLSWDEKIRADVWYVQNYTLMLDIRILLRTLRFVMSRRGVYLADGEARPTG